jgi:hypothetical protein
MQRWAIANARSTFRNVGGRDVAWVVSGRP